MSTVFRRIAAAVAAAAMFPAACLQNAALLPQVCAEDTKYIALTFDDGTNTTTTGQVLDVLEEYDAKASFFLVGNNIDEASAKSVKRAFDEELIAEAKAYLKSLKNFQAQVWWVGDASYKTIDASNAKITGVYLKTANTDTTEVTSAPTEPVTGSSEFTCGDVDGSGTVDVLDVIAVNKYLLGAKVLDKDAMQRADADQSGVTDASDSLLILKYVVELIDTLPVAA